MSPCCDLDLEDNKLFFSSTALWLIMPHRHTKFGNKMLGSLDDIIWTNADILPLHCDRDRECIHPFFHKTLWLMVMYHQTKFGCQGTNSSENIVERVIF